MYNSAVSETPVKRRTEQEDPTSPSPLDLSSNSLDNVVRPPKKMRASDSSESLTPTVELLQPAKDLISNTDQYPLSFNQTIQLLEAALGEENIIDLIYKFTSDVEGVRTLLYDIYPIVKHKSIKNRCKKYFLNCAYTNIASLLAKFDEFSAFVKKDKPSFILLTETWLTPSIPDTLISLGGYTVFRRDRIGRRGGGACIYILDYVLSKLEVSWIDVDVNSVDSIFLKFSSRSLTFILGCVYRPPSSPLIDDQSFFGRISEMVNEYDKVFLFGDSHKICQAIKYPSFWKRILSTFGRFIVQLGQQPSVLDLIITSDKTSLTNLKFSDPIGYSDHLVLNIDFQICTILKTRIIMSSKMVTDFKAVNNYLSKVDWKIVLSAPSVVENWCTFKDILDNTISRYSFSFVKKRSSTKPWINGRILKLINKKRALWRVFKRTRTDGDFRIHREFSNELSYIIKDARVAYEKRIADQKDPKSFYKYVRSKLSGPVTTPRIKDVD
ncbi:Exo endo phos domain containing protein, partial [Asbolus verrucosus]